MRIKDPAQSFSPSSTTRFSLQNGFDAILYKYPTFIAMELKSTASTSISFASKEEKSNKSKSIKYYQISSLEYAARFNIKAGFLLNFRRTNSTYWIYISDFMSFYNSTNKKSINQDDLLQYNAILVPQTLKRVHYTYDLSFLFQYPIRESEV